MKPGTKCFSFVSLIAISLLFTACSGLPQGASSGTGTGATSYTIGGMVMGLQQGSTGLVLADNGTDKLNISANGSFTFATSVAAQGTYAVTVFALPTPAQTCIVTSGGGTASAAVTSVMVTCSVGTGSIGGNVTGLTGSNLVLQDNGKDNLTINAPGGAFTFQTAITLGNAYNVTVLTQPTSPSQTCIVVGGSGTASANVGNIQITCSVGTLSIGGSIAGLSKAGSGIILQDNGGDTLTVTANGNFTFPSLLPAGAAYAVTIKTQPSGPAQTCTIMNGSGTTTTVNITNAQITCPAIFHTISGNIVGVDPTAINMIITDNGGDNLPAPSNGPFQFVTPIADGSVYDVDIFVGPGPLNDVGCVVYGYTGIAISDVTNVSVDCGHNDWTWMDGDNTGNQMGSFTAIPSPLPTTPALNTSTPGGRRYPATWTDLSGNLWLFGGYGYSYDPTVPLQPGYFSDMWKYQHTDEYFGGYYAIWQVVDADGVPPLDPRWGAVTWTDTNGKLWLFGGSNDVFFYNDLWNYNTGSDTWTQVSGGRDIKGVYGTINVTAAGQSPGARWGATVRYNPATKQLWLFGGFGYDDVTDSAQTQPGLLNDLWVFDGTNWTWVSGSDKVNAPGVYNTIGNPTALTVPGARQSSASWLDNSGNFWIFGGFDLNGTGQPDALNDLWEYNVTTKEWTWTSGSNTVNQPAVYGTQGIAAATNVPGAAWSSAAWTDLSGNFWLFGGQGFDSTGDGSLSDLWEYKAGQWIWVKGPGSVSQAGVYGIKPTPRVWPEVTNNPGGRWAPGFWTVDQPTFNLPPAPATYREFWIFGGEGEDSQGGDGNDLLDDLFRYLPYP